MPPRPTLLVSSRAMRLLTPRSSAVRCLSSLTTTINKSTLSQPRRPPPTSVTTTRPYSSWLLSAVSSAASALNAPAPGGPNQNSAPETVLRARRILPYPPSHLYNLIADVSSYDQFLPHCSRSVVTAWASAPTPATQPAQAGPTTTTTAGGEGALGQGQDGVKRAEGTREKKWPARGDLTVGWGPFTESYSSRVYCVPDDGTGLGIVEAVSGNASTNIPSATLQKFGYQAPSYTEKMEGLFESLVTRWTVREVPAPGGVVRKDGEKEKWTEVALSVRFKFANPALGFAVGQLAGQKVDEMVQAFEERARRTWRR